MIENVLPELSDFIEKRLGILSNVSKDAPLEQTYGMAGLDSLLFYDDFLTEFKIELPDNFDINHYASPDAAWTDFFKRLFSKKYRDKHWYLDLTINDLEEMIKTKKWTTRK